MTFGKSAWDIATGGSDNVMNFFNPAVRGNVMTLTTTGNLSITGIFAQGSFRELKENITYDDISNTHSNEVKP